MKPEQLSELKLQLKIGKPDPALVAAFVDAYETQQRAEGFWSVRAPQMNEELLVLRRLENHARGLINRLPPTGKFGTGRDLLVFELDKLNSLRVDHAKESA
jgi:hypothetical protein